MPLTLITGPANAEKARAVLDAYQTASAGRPLLVAPGLTVAQLRGVLLSTAGRRVVVLRPAAGALRRLRGSGRAVVRVRATYAADNPSARTRALTLRP